MKAYLIAYDGKFKNAVVSGHASKSEAEAAGPNAGKEKFLVVQSVSDLQQFSLQELVDIYNGVNGSSLSRFRDLKSGQDRVLLTIASLVNVKVRDENVEANGGGDASQESSDMPKTPTRKPAKKATKAAAPKKEPSGIAKKSRLNGDAKIDIVTKANPRREGSAGFKSYALMTQGMKVSTYLEKGGRPQDLRWDVAAGNVKLID